MKTFHSITGNCIEPVRARGVAVLDKEEFEDGMGIKIATLGHDKKESRNALLTAPYIYRWRFMRPHFY